MNPVKLTELKNVKMYDESRAAKRMEREKLPERSKVNLSTRTNPFSQSEKHRPIDMMERESILYHIKLYL